MTFHNNNNSPDSTIERRTVDTGSVTKSKRFIKNSAVVVSQARKTTAQTSGLASNRGGLNSAFSGD